MTDLREITVAATDLEALDSTPGRVALCMRPDGKMSPAARRMEAFPL